MTRRRLLAYAIAVGLSAILSSSGIGARGQVPARLTDEEFWRLSVDSSEPNGYFRSDNLISNELWFQHVIPDLVKRTRPGDVYLGVGPEQNYTYIAAVKPALAVVFDIRRGNLHLQLMYKAIFELTKDRADFMSMLFSRLRPPQGLSTTSTAKELFDAIGSSPRYEPTYRQNLRRIEDHLTKTHHLPLSNEDLEGIEYVFHSFFEGGFSVRPYPSYDQLMTEDDGMGENRSYLATEEGFQVMKQLEAKNLVVPVVGDFAGPKAIRAIAAYLKAREAVVSTFYLSNVEQYLYQDSKWRRFCENVATLPLDSSSTFIRSSNGGNFAFGRGPRFISTLGDMLSETNRCDR